MQKSKLLFLALLFVGCGDINIQAKDTNGHHPLTEVSLLDDNLEVIGANYVTRTPEKLSFQRFSKELLALPTKDLAFNAKKGRTDSGIIIRFTTKSPTVELVFVPDEGDNRGANYAAYNNGKQIATYSFNKKQSADTVHILLEGNGKEVTWELTMPSWASVALQNLKLEDGYNLLKNKEKKSSVYLAIGNSITHGVGQLSATYLTYPFLLARSLDKELYNLAVGGAKVSQPLAEMLQELPQADLITVLIGYNDLHGSAKSVEQFISDYEPYLKTIRKNQPKADIYCISMTYTNSLGNEKTGLRPDDFRKAAKEVITKLQKSDKQLFFVAGEEITSIANLRVDNPKDKVHFGIEGAALFAKELEKIITRM